jgi:hypothetical protein
MTAAMARSSKAPEIAAVNFFRFQVEPLRDATATESGSMAMTLLSGAVATLYRNTGV